MKDLIILRNNQPLTTSLKVAEVFEKEHKNVVRDIEKLTKEIGSNLSTSQMFIESNYADQYGRRQPMYLMNQDGFSLLAMGFTGKKALQFKLAYIAEFNRMREILRRQADPYWQFVRQSSKETNKEMARMIKAHVIPTARKHDFIHDDRYYYKKYNHVVNDTAGVPAGQRDKLPASKLIMLDQMQDIMNVVLSEKEYASEDELCEEVTEALNDFARVARIAERVKRGLKNVD